MLYVVAFTMRSHTATGIFRDMDHAEDAQQYLLAQEFTEDDIVTEALKDQTVLLKVHADTSIEMQEAVDVLRNYGAVDITMTK
jgi:hypothetical protein